MNKKLVIMVVSVIAVLIGTFFSINFYKKTKTDAYKFKVEYEKLNGKNSKSGRKNRNVTISSDNPFIYLTAEQLLKKINNKETFIVYFGFSECPWCRSMVENLIEVAKKKNIDEIYYVNISNIRDVKELKNGKIVTTKDGSKAYMRLVKKLDNVLSEYTLKDSDGNEVEVGEKRIYAPNIVGVVNGRAEKKEDGVSPNEKDPYANITKKMNTESKKEIECLFKCLEKANMCTSKTTC